MSTFEKEFISLRKKLIEREFSRMNDMQLKAVTKIEGPLLILAGAGSGKTTVLINRIVNIVKYGRAYLSEHADVTEQHLEQLRAYLDGTAAEPPIQVSENPVRPWEILAITFTNKAANELKERLNTALGVGGEEVWAATFHSTCSRILRRYGDRLGYTSHFTIYDTDDQRRLMKDVQKQLKIDDKILPHRAILSEISHAKDSLISPDEYAKDAGFDVRKKSIASAYALYQKQLKSFDAMDFDDLLVETVRLFEENPDVLDYYQNRFKYIMVDEYQDTNHVQYMFTKLLADKHRNICVVGDDDQSIYRFRGATIENILSFEHQYRDAEVIRLEQNYRSTQIILDAANAVISNNSARKGKNLWTSNEGGENISVFTAYDEQGEARFVADTILENVQKGGKLSDHAVLYRMNAQSNAIENVFMRSGITYRVVGGLKFFDRKEIKDVIAYLNVINNPSDGIGLRRIINEPKRGIGDTTVGYVTQIAAEVGIAPMEVLRTADEYAALKRSAPKLMEFAALIGHLSETAEQMSAHEFLEYMLNKTGYMNALKVSGEGAQDRIDNVNELSSSILQYEQDNENATLAGFLEEIALVTDMDSGENTNDMVILMTMHAAKGLEFPIVFIVGVEDGIFPGSQSIYGGLEDMEEERRLAYVGITRAKQKLYITNANSRMLFGRTERYRPSRFIGEIPDELIDASSSGYSPAFSSFGLPTGSSRDKTAAFAGSSVTGSIYARQTGAQRLSESAHTVQSKPDAGQKPGDRVRHKVFGEGLVVSVALMGNDMLLEIAFDKVGTKKIMANFAKLEKI